VVVSILACRLHQNACVSLYKSQLRGQAAQGLNGDQEEDFVEKIFIASSIIIWLIFTQRRQGVLAQSHQIRRPGAAQSARLLSTWSTGPGDKIHGNPAVQGFVD
jgi:hypothetical protein